MKSSPVKVWRRGKKNGSVVGKKGTIIAFTIIHGAPSGFSEMVPYPVVLVKMVGGTTQIGQLVDYTKEDIVKGREVIAVIRRIHSDDKEGIISYHTKFKPS